MRGLKRMLVVGALAAGVVGSAVSPASANTGGTCNGLVDVGCNYCSYAGGNYGNDPYNCGHYSNYTWEGCTVWVSGVCEVG